MIDIKQLEVDLDVIVQFTYKNLDSVSIYGKIKTVNETEIAIEPMGFWGCKFQGIILTPSSKIKFTNNNELLKFNVDSILKIIPAGTRKLIQIKKYI